MPYHTMSDAELDEIWDDGLHFKPAGYEKIGKLVAQKLLDIMKSDGGNSN
jgi:lysophospholipase L1-like esterase